MGGPPDEHNNSTNRKPILDGRIMPGGIYGIHYKDRLTADDVLGGTYQRTGTPVKGGQYSQRQMIKQQLHNQNLRLREAFVREDVRLTGTIAGNMPQVAATLRSGGLDLSKAQVQQARKTFVTGDGRFNWELFCDAIEKARTDANKESNLMKHARMFKQIDQDNSGRISRDELEAALHSSNVSMPQDQIDKVLNTIDADGDGNISYPEFVDGMAKEMMTGSNVFSRVATANSMRSPRRQ